MSVTDDDLRHHDKEEEAVGDDDDVTVRVLLADVKSLREARNNNDETKVNGEHHHKDLVQVRKEYETGEKQEVEEYPSPLHLAGPGQ